MSEESEGAAAVVVGESVVSKPAAAGGESGAASPAVEDLGKVREWMLKANPDVVPELVAGSSVGELEGSLAAARAAFVSVADRVKTAAAAAGSGGAGGAAGAGAVAAPVVPAGGAAVVVNPDSLPTGEKIRRGLAARTQQS